MSNYNTKAAFTCFVKSGAYLARDLVPMDEITDSRVERWRSSAMELIRIGKRMFKEVDDRDTTIKEMQGLLEDAKHQLRHSAGNPNSLYKKEYHACADKIRDYLNTQENKDET